MIHVWTLHGVVFVQWGEKGVVRSLSPDGSTAERFTLPADATSITEECTCEF